MSECGELTLLAGMISNHRTLMGWSIALLLPFLAVSSNAPAQSQSLMRLEDTYWSGKDSGAAPFVFGFERSGKFRYIPATGVVSKGRWKQTGHSVEMEINGSFVRFSGTIVDELLKGEASSKKGLRWNWTATKQPVVLSNTAPRYPAIANAARASSDVLVELTISAAGDVVAARAIGGHALFRTVSEMAGRLWKFEQGVANDRLRSAQVFFSFRLLTSGLHAKEVPPVFLSPYQAVITQRPVRIVNVLSH